MDILEACQAVLDCSRSLPDHQFDETTWKALLEAKNDAERVYDMLIAKRAAQQMKDSHPICEQLARAIRLMWDISAEMDFTRARVRFYQDLAAGMLAPGYALYTAQDGCVLQSVWPGTVDEHAEEKQINGIIYFVAEDEKTVTFVKNVQHAVYLTLF